MISSENWEVEWLVAALAPWTVSPHPNFRDDEVSGAAALALVTEMRDRSEGYNIQPEASSISNWRDLLVASARGSLGVDTQAASADRLLELSEARDLPPGARAAAVLFGSVALCELEKHSEAVNALAALVEELGGADGDPSEYTASQRLIIASVFMQLSARLTESCKFEEARDRVRQTIEWLPTLKDSSLQEFAVSGGISWGASTVQRDLVRSVGSHALSLKSNLEQIGGHTWVRVVRGRTSWIDMRMHLRSADRDEIVLRDAFERRVEADSNTRHFGRIAADGAGYRSLTLAELSGHLGFMRGEREKLGKVLILERGDSPERVREAVRLLRQGRATKALQAAITWIRAQGPSISLVDDALIVTNRVNSARWCTEQDLLVLEGASDFLSPQQKDQAISAALLFADTPQLQRQMSWSSWERLWKTISRLVPASTRHNEIASLAYRYIANQASLSQPIANTLARLVSSLDWQEVESEVTGQWSHLAEAIERDFETSVLLDAVDENVRGAVRPIPADLGVERAAHLADEGLPDDEAGDTIPALASYLGTLLRQEAEHASNGMMSVGGYQNANVAVAFALRFPSDHLWDEILRHLLNSKVDAGLKDLAVERLAENVTRLPSAVATKLREDIHLLIASERREGMFTQSESEVFGEAVRLSAALGAAPRSDLLETVLRLATAGVKDRIQAAKTIPLSISEADATWGHVLLLQLSHDPDPSVRAAAGHALVRSLSTSSELTDAVYSRIVNLLKSDGIKVPLAVLHAVQRSARLLNNELEPLVAQINVLASSEGNYVTQGAARICLEMLSNPT
ncbi:hypothetical protein [Salinibacterium sp. ZJ450]|uniref:hypothetical protein n=1 Tax=Salinibacterium sp. ZJ450 TaxID=2708338 RepID=UPI00141DCF09|nr:hypothetical protein [Salinibacterium sp. ZJ450]